MLTSEKLSLERDKVMYEKAQYDADRETVIKIQVEVDFQKSVLQSEYLKAEELEHELSQRQNMLNMLQFSKDSGDRDLSALQF
jgi:hypothetical protein